MSVKASLTAAAAPPERREQAPDAPAIAHASMANAIRALAMDAVEQAKSGHPGMPMGMADVATVLFSRFLKFDPTDPTWADRDRFILSAGHGSMLIYALLHLTGYEAVTLDQIKKFRQLGSNTAGHPEHGHTPGVETTTGPLGQGLANAVGMAIAERHLAAVFGDTVVDHKTYVIASDGDLMEGISHEAIALAGHLKLNKLIVLFDDNGISIDGALSLADSVDQVKRFEAAGWSATRIDGHDPAAIDAALEKAQTSDKPVLIACRTKIGFGAPTKQGSEKSHGSPLGAEEIAGARKILGWTSAPFDVPADVLKAWRTVGARSKGAHADWKKRLAGLEGATRAEFERRMKGDLPKQALTRAVRAVKEKLAAQPKDIASRTACEFALESLIPDLPEMIGGSADLTGSNNTRIKGMKAISAADFSGRFIHYGVREHGMAAAMNGMALHGGIVPYSGTFLVFSDYCRPAIRLAALMGKRVIHIMTHDSIGLGEDGPTHQPVEHLAALRAIPNLLVFRPCDAVETAECWQLALEFERPSEHNSTHAAEPAAAAQPPRRGQYLRAWRLRDRGPRWSFGRLDLRHGFRSFDCGRRCETAGTAWHRGARGFSAVFRIVPGTGCGLSPRHHRGCPRKGRCRGRDSTRLGCHYRFRRDLCRHAIVRRERAVQGTVQEIWNYR